MKPNTVRGVLVRVSAVVAAAALAVTGAATAHAADIPDSSTVVITKLSTPPTGPGAAATGVQSGQTGGPTIPAGATGIADVVFTAYPITVAGTSGSNAWQQNVADISLADAQGEVDGGSYTGSPIVLTATDGTGVTSWSNAARGLYLIRETTAPAGVTPAGDFLLAVPLTDPVNLDNWLSTIYVYPKNSSVSATKTVSEGTSVAVGQSVTWTVLADIPRDAAITKYELADTLDSRLTYASSVVDLTGASGVTLTGPGASDDYDIVTTGSTYTLIFSAAGRAKLVTAWQADATAQVRWAITTTLNSTALNAANTAAASIVNTPVLTVNDATPKTGTPATVKVGDIKLVKQDAVSGNPLPNDLTAQFSVYRTEADAQARTNPISINGTTVFTTTAGTGALTISGLLFSDYVDGATVSDPAAYRSYWVNEVTAPTGYQLLADPIQVDVTAAGSDSTVIAVGNVPNTGGFVLPLTGGSGTAALTIGGVAILGIVLIVAVRRRASGNATK